MMKMRSSALVLAFFGGLGIACHALGSDPGSEAVSQAVASCPNPAAKPCSDPHVCDAVCGVNSSACFALDAGDRNNITQVWVDVDQCDNAGTPKFPPTVFATENSSEPFEQFDLHTN